MAFTKQQEEVVFVAFGKENAKTNSYIVEAGKSIEGTVVKIIDSQLYKKVYQLQVSGIDKPLVITGKTALNEQMGYGTKVVTPVQEGDLVRITYLGMYKTNKGKNAYKFDVEVDR